MAFYIKASNFLSDIDFFGKPSRIFLKRNVWKNTNILLLYFAVPLKSSWDIVLKQSVMMFTTWTHIFVIEEICRYINTYMWWSKLACSWEILRLFYLLYAYVHDINRIPRKSLEYIMKQKGYNMVHTYQAPWTKLVRRWIPFLY